MNIKNYLARIKAKFDCIYYSDILLLSYPKCGRTWLRIFLSKYICEHENISFKENIFFPRKKNNKNIPAIYIDHMSFPSKISFISWSFFLRNLNFIQPIFALFHKIKGTSVIFVVRDPRDVLVSYFFDSTRRSSSSKYKKFTIKSMLRDPVYGIESIINYMNKWHASSSKFKRYKLIRYEDLINDSESEFSNIVTFIYPGQQLDKTALKKALAFSSFTNMQSLERSGTFNKKYFGPGDTDDPNSYKVRKGKIGNYVEHFDAEDIKYAAEAMSNLNKEFGYKI